MNTHPLDTPCPDCGHTQGTTSQSGPHLKLSCAKCKRYIKFVSQLSEEEKEKRAWAARSIRYLVQKELLRERDRSFGESLCGQLDRTGKLTPQQWAALRDLCGRYRWKLPPAPDSRQQNLFGESQPPALSEEHQELLKAAEEYAEKLNQGLCPRCNKPVEPRRQLGRCIYGACGHRLGQGQIRGAR